MKRGTWVALAGVGIVIAACLVAGYFVYTSAEKAQQDAANEYQQENKQEYGMGDTLLLDSSLDKEGTGYGYEAGFDWTGAMEVTLMSAVEYDSPSSAGISNTELLDSAGIGESQKFVVCELKLHNVDAEISNEFGDKFNISIFQLRSGDIPSLPPDPLYLPSYFSGTLPGVDESDVYYYALEKGEEKIFKLGYFVPEEAVREGLFYKIGASGGASRYLINVVIGV